MHVRQSLLLFLGLAALGVSGARLACQTQNTAPAADSKVLAQSGVNTLTEKDIEQTLFIDDCVLDTPLSASELQQARQNIITQFENDPAAFTKSKPLSDKVADLLRHGPISDRTEIAVQLWVLWNQKSQSDAHTKWWVDLVRQHNPPIAQSGDLKVTRLQLDGLFADNDWVAKTAGLPQASAETRAAYARQLRQKFAAMTPEEKQRLARADVRWFDFHDPILDHSDLLQIARNHVRENVRGPQDVYAEARTLEDIGVRFNDGMAQFAHNMAAIGGLDFQTKSNIHNLNFADNKFWGRTK